MDLNLYLGLPHSPIRRGWDLGSDLALGSLLSEEIHASREISGSVETLGWHAPYSPTHASYTPNQDSGIQNPRLEYSPYTPLTFSVPSSNMLVSPYSNNEPNDSSHLGYYPYASTYIPAQRTGTEHSHRDDVHAPLGHVPYSSSYVPTTEQVSREPVVVENYDDFVDYVPGSNPAPVSPQQSNLGLILDDVDPYVPSSPPYGPIFLTDGDSGERGIENDNNDLEYVPRSPSYVPISPSIGMVQTPDDSPHQQPNEGLIHEDLDPFYISSSPPLFIPSMPTPQVYDNHSSDGSSQSYVVSQRQVIMRNSEPLALEDSSQEGFREHQENHFGRIEPNHRRRFRRFWLASPYRAGPDYDVASLSIEDYMLQETMASEGFVETSETRSRKVAESLFPVDTKEETKDQDSSASYFECNVCLDIAKDPVVTSCGHLFCWPCLYQWLHLHSDHKECPVCKGKVTEANITPIYGRGSSKTGVEKTIPEGGNPCWKIPPRPHGNRIESLRQQISRPRSRRLGHEISSWTGIVDEEIRNANRVEGQESTLPEDGANYRVFSRQRAFRRLQREETSRNGLNLGSTGLSRNIAETSFNSQSGSSHGNMHYGPHLGSRSRPALPEGIDFSLQLALLGMPSLPRSARDAALNDGISSVVESTTRITDHFGASGSANPQNTRHFRDQSAQGVTPGADQASSSTTMAMMQGDVGVLNTSPEANHRGSSHFRRRRNGVSSYLGVDGGVHNSNRRWQLN